MFSKVASVFAVFLVSAQVAIAQPPACLIAAVNTQSDPSDVKSVCTSGISEVQKFMSSNCGNNVDAANSAFAEICKSAGVTISTSSSSSTSPSSSASSPGSSSSSSAGQTGTTAPSSSSSGTPSTGSTSPTSPSSANHTGAASRLGMDLLGLGALALFGAMLAA